MVIPSSPARSLAGCGNPARLGRELRRLRHTQGLAPTAPRGHPSGPLHRCPTEAMRQIELRGVARSQQCLACCSARKVQSVMAYPLAFIEILLGRDQSTGYTTLPISSHTSEFTMARITAVVSNRECCRSCHCIASLRASTISSG